jgi:hypothetical protein
MVQFGEQEEALMKAQFDAKVSIFKCDEWAVFSNRPVELWNGGLKTFAIPGRPAKLGPVPGHPDWTMMLNVNVFLRAWSKIGKLGHFRNHDWTVKVDVDAVFIPQRLRTRLAQHMRFQQVSPEDEVYFRNCAMFNSLQGPVEVFSKGAVERFLQHGNKETCLKDVVPDAATIGEDWFMKLCMDLLNVQAIGDWRLLSDGKCGEWQTSTMCGARKDTVVFHPFKDATRYFKCISEVGTDTIV